MASTPTDAGRGRSTRALVGAGVFGFGLSAVVDVLLLHHVLQWHHLVSARVTTATVEGLRTNVLADGLFSLVMLLVAGVGAGLVWRAERRTATPLAARPLAGLTLVGVGVFDLFDVVVDHTLLGLHHALSRGGAYDPYWALVSLGIVALGVLVYRSAPDRPREASDGPA
jgi:uncharacterized membrane protein